jgi:23S rRNA (cytidine1920-2'-O)/16S rRNA (cytidine1409-2'-O)-methyltransferase
LRLDNYLVEKGLCDSRNKAQEFIKNGYVRVDGKVIKKPSFTCNDTLVEVDDIKQYVSRSALKLKGILDEISLHVENLRALDIGSSRGGFCEVLLESGVKSVTALDVGTNQLHEKIATDKRVIVKENQDVREFEDDRYELVTCDVSFISLHNILNDIDRLSSKDIIILFKPQFEVGREVKRDSKGVIKDEKAIQKSEIKFEDACALLGWKMVHKSVSVISGKDGNIEKVYYFTKC